MKTHSKIYYFISLMRPHQYYKNLLIFLPLIFAKHLLLINDLLKTTIGFLLLCLLSSSYYIINDIVDYKKDKNHPEKKLRPLASGKISKSEALITSIFLILIVLFFSYRISTLFFYALITLLSLALMYNFWLKNEVFADIIILSTNFVIRAISGAFIINVKVSPWLILCTFFLALFLASGKREANIALLNEKSKLYKKVLLKYNKNLTRTLMIISTTSLIISYSLYSFLSDFKNLIITLPISLYTIFYYFYLIENGSPVARNPELVFKEKRILTAIIIWMLLVLLCVYTDLIRIPLLK